MSRGLVKIRITIGKLVIKVLRSVAVLMPQTPSEQRRNNDKTHTHSTARSPYLADIIYLRAVSDSDREHDWRGAGHGDGFHGAFVIHGPARSLSSRLSFAFAHFTSPFSCRRTRGLRRLCTNCVTPLAGCRPAPRFISAKKGSFTDPAKLSV